MLVRCLGLVAAVATAAHAAPPTDAVRASHDRSIEVLPAAAAPAPVRDHVDVAYQAVPPPRAAAWAAFGQQLPGLTRATWDRATGVPSRIWGRGLDVPGSVADGDVAAAAALRVLAANLALLAPGATIADFELVANDLDGGLRTVGFVQRHGGLAVVGGQVSFRFKHDRLFVIGSEALPDVRVAWPQAAKPAAAIAAVVGPATAADLGLDPATISVRTDGPLQIVPLVGDHGVLGYRVATPVAIDAGAAGGWRVWADPTTGAPLVRQSTTPSAAGAVAFTAVNRYPARPRSPSPAIRLAVTADGADAITDEAGAVTWSGTGSTALALKPTGPDVLMTNAAGALATFTATLAPGGTATWDASGDEAADAQVSAFVHATIVRSYAKRFAPELEFLTQPVPVRVNIDDECNAFSDGTAINFFASSQRCENTGRIADVVYHEYGHSIHNHSIIPGAGFFDGAFSEGLSDYLAATITDDSGMGRGFFRNDTPLRELDPPDSEWTWPRDIGEIHATGRIFAGAMWDLRKALIAELPDRDAAVRLADRLYYGAVRRAPSIPATLIEVLATDDDDGDLANGTPHECTIRAAFARHGLRTVKGEIDAAGSFPASVVDPQPVHLDLSEVDTHCGDTIASVTLEWQPRDGSITAGTATARAEGDRWTADLPMPANGGALFFRFRVRYADGSDSVFPDNLADPWYQLYHGDVVPLYCTDFEHNPLTDGWRAGGDHASAWQWGVPGGALAVGDPRRAFSGTRIVGTGLSFVDATYPANATMWFETPRIDVGDFSDVHLQYRRWLNAEDGFYDHATIEVNGEQAWANVSSQGNNSHTTHHEDKAWLFQDVPLSSRIFDGTVVVRWILKSDPGFELGGWNLDDVCIVANPASVCGDGVMTRTEQCDDGDANGDAPDHCRAGCRRASCGDGIVDSREECDDGNEDDTDTCSNICTVIEPRPGDVDGGCAAGGGGTGAGAALGLALAALVSRRRRR